MKSIKVGITGGIGSGKSFVAKIFKTLDIPFYDADREAKELMHSHQDIRESLIKAFSPQIYTDLGVLDRGYLANKVFNDKAQLTLLNSIVHPIVIAHGMEWANAQTSAYSLKEAALLFESGSFKMLDFTIVVTAPEKLRLERVIERDGVTAEEVYRRMANQMPEQDKVNMADFVITNDESQPLLPQIIKIHEILLQK